jgi:hypothetical protein
VKVTVEAEPKATTPRDEKVEDLGGLIIKINPHRKKFRPTNPHRGNIRGARADFVFQSR